VPDLTSRLIVELVDRVSANAGKTGKAIHGISDEMTKLQGVSRKFADTRDMFKGFTGAQAGFAKAKENINRITRELRDAKKAIEQMNGVKLVKGDILFAPLKAGRDKVKELERELKSAQREVSSTSRIFVEQGKAIKGALSDLGIKGIKNFITAEQQLKASVDAANQSFREQKKFSESGWTLRHNSPIGPPAPAAKPNWRDRFKRPAGLPGPNVGGLYGMAASAAGGAGVYDAARYAYDFESYKNKMEGRGGWSRSDVNSFADYARRQAVRTGLAGSSGASGLAAMGEIFGKAGLDQKAARGALMPTLQFARYGDIPDEEAASTIVRGATVFRLPMNTVGDASKSSTRIADIMAYAANKTLADVGDISQGFKFAAPMAQALGMQPEQLASYIATMVQAGNAGDEAGVAMRSALTRSVRPTLDSAQAMSELGLSFSDFATQKRTFTAPEAVASLRTMQGRLKGGATERLQGLLDKNPQADMQNLLTDFFNSEVAPNGKATSLSLQDKAKMAGWVNKFLSSQFESVDIDAMLKALHEKGATVGHMARIFDQRQAGRLLPLLDSPKYAELMSGMATEAPGSAQRGANIMMQGIVGDWSKFTASLQEMVLAFSDSGALRSAADAIRDITDAMQTLNNVGKAKFLGKYNLGDILSGKSSGDAGRAVGDMIGTSKIGPAIKRWWSGSNDGKPMGSAMGSFHLTQKPSDPPAPYSGNIKVLGNQSDVKVETVAANSKIAEVKDNLTNLSTVTATPMVALNGAEATLGVLKSILDYIKQINATQVSPPGMRGVHADVGSGSSSGW
jgi:TP901 family phage tail tape measure protein